MHFPLGRWSPPQLRGLSLRLREAGCKSRSHGTWHMARGGARAGSRLPYLLAAAPCVCGLHLHILFPRRGQAAWGTAKETEPKEMRAKGRMCPSPWWPGDRPLVIWKPGKVTQARPSSQLESRASWAAAGWPGPSDCLLPSPDSLSASSYPSGIARPGLRAGASLNSDRYTRTTYTRSHTELPLQAAVLPTLQCHRELICRCL